MKIVRIFPLAAAALTLAACTSTPVGFTEMDNIRPAFDGGGMAGSGGLVGGADSAAEGGTTAPADSTCTLCGQQMGGSGG